MTIVVRMDVGAQPRPEGRIATPVGAWPRAPETACVPPAPRGNHVLRQDARSWQDGYRSGCCGLGVAHGDGVGGFDGWSWSSGYIEGKADRCKAREVVIRLDAVSEH